MAENDELVAFIRQDAERLLRGLTSEPEIKPGPRAAPMLGLMFGRTTSSGIGLAAPGNVEVFRPTATGWAITSPVETILCWCYPTAISGVKNVMVFVVDGRHVAMELC